MHQLLRAAVLPEPELPDAAELIAQGRSLANSVTPGPCPFLAEYDVRCESDYKKRCMAEGTVMFHAQFGFRSQDKSRRAYAEIYEQVAAAGYRVDRYGICLDWSMGYPAAQRADMPRGTGLILESPDDFACLTQGAPVAAHFGDFVIGTPGALENTAAALAAGSTSIGNLGQYFTFRMPHWNDDVFTTAEMVKALALCAAQPVDVLVHSNLDDGFAALFCDMSCAIGAVLVERYIVDELIGGRVSHCYGHVYSEPLTRLAFQRALSRVTDAPGTMVYGNTTIYVASDVENYANLASYLLIDLIGQRSKPTGHAVNPVPVTEAQRIPDIDEIVNAQLVANRLALRTEGFESLFDFDAVEQIASRLVDGGLRFKERVLNGLSEAGIDTHDPLEMLLSIRRIGAKRLEELWGPGEQQSDTVRGRTPVVRASTVAALQDQGGELIAELADTDREAIRKAGFTACVACTDVHEYGKILVETVLRHLNVQLIDAAVSTDPDVVARLAKTGGASFVAVSTYSGVALDYLRALHSEMTRHDIEIPIFVGGKLNQIPGDASSSMPVDVTKELRESGAIVCQRVEDMLEELARMARSAGCD